MPTPDPAVIRAAIEDMRDKIDGEWVTPDWWYDADHFSDVYPEQAAFIAAMSPAFVLRMCDADLELLDAAARGHEGPWSFLLANLARRYGVAS